MILGKEYNHNAVREIRENLFMSKAELARKAGVSPLTINNVEKGLGCRMDTKRKIILALGFNSQIRTRYSPVDNSSNDEFAAINHSTEVIQ